MFFSAVSDTPAAARFKEKISLDKDIKFAIARPTRFVDRFQLLFYPECAVFQHYVLTGDVPLMTLEDQSRFLLVTPLPGNIQELYLPAEKSLLGDSTFWTKWV